MYSGWIQDFIDTQIIFLLDKEGINLQETLLNLEKQGYKEITFAFYRQMKNEAITKIIMEAIWM